MKLEWRVTWALLWSVGFFTGAALTEGYGGMGWDMVFIVGAVLPLGFVVGPWFRPKD